MLYSFIGQELGVDLRYLRELTDRFIDRFLCFFLGHNWDYTDDDDKTLGRCLTCGKEVVWKKNIKGNR